MPPSFVFVIMKSALQCGWDPLFQFPFCMKMAQRMIRLFKHSAPTALFTQWSILYQKSTITFLGCVIRQTYSNFVDFCVVSGWLASRKYHYHFVSTAHFWSKKESILLWKMLWVAKDYHQHFKHRRPQTFRARHLLLSGWHLVEKTGS